MKNTLITGTNRGLGFELVRQCLARGDRVFGTCRDVEAATELQELATNHPDQLTIIELDVTDEQAIDRCVEIVQSHTTHVDLLFNNAGISPDGEEWSNLSPETLLHSFHVNAVAPVILTNRLYPLLKASQESKVINLSSGQASVSKKGDGGKYSYGSSKTALNMLSRTMAFGLRDDGIIVTAITPGWTRTDMGGPNAPNSPEESIQGVLKVVDNLTMEDTGEFLTWEGEHYHW